MLKSLGFFFSQESQEPSPNLNGHLSVEITTSSSFVFVGDNNGDWACDCRPTYLYSPQSLRCYEAFTQGPCNQTSILVLPKGKSVPVCVRNECGAGKVKYNNNCLKVGSYEGCKQAVKGAKTFILRVDATTLQLNCSSSLSSRFTEFISEETGTYEEVACFLGGKRSQENLCA